MPPVASGDGSPNTTPRKRTCERLADGYSATDVLWPITPIKPAFFERPARSRYPNNCGEIRCARSSGERYTNWGSNGSRPTVRKRKGASLSLDDPEGFQTTSRYALSLADCGPRSIRSPVRVTLARTACAADLPAVVRVAAAGRPFEKCWLYRCNGPKDVRSAVPIRQTFAGSLPWCRVR